MILYLVRHGESAFNAEGRIQGQLDAPLSELGRRQSIALAASFRGAPIDAVYTSPLSRARDTAAPIAAAVGVAPLSDERLLELYAGSFQGLTWPEINARWPDAAAAWKAQDPDYHLPGRGESRRELMQRALTALEAIREVGHRQVIVVAHGGVLAAGLKALLGIPPQRNPFSFYNGSISQGEWQLQFRLVTLNQLDHLHGGGEDLRTRTGDL